MKRKLMAKCGLITGLCGWVLSSAFGQPAPADRDSPQQRGGRGGAPERGVYKARVTPHWFANDTRFWYRNDLRGETREFILVDAEKGTRQAAFDHEKLAAALSKAAKQEFKAGNLPFSTLQFNEAATTVKFDAGGKAWECDLKSYECKEAGTNSAVLYTPGETMVATASYTGGESSSPFAEDGDRPGRESPQQRTDAKTTNAPAEDPAPDEGFRGRRSRKSPDGKWTAVVHDSNLFLHGADGAEKQLSHDGAGDDGYGLIEWAPDSQTVVAWRIERGDRKEVYLVTSSPKGGGRAVLHQRPYGLPGDKFTHYELNVFAVADGKQTKPAIEKFEHEWEQPAVHWFADKHRFGYEQEDRGHQRLRIISVDSGDGSVGTLVEEKTETFIWTAHTENLNLNLVNWLTNSDEMIYVSEKDGWRHLYLVDAKAGGMKQITKGEWVIRGVDKIDEDARQVWFRAGGMNSAQDPYFVHYYRANFDGTGLVALTEGDGMHGVQYSPDRKYLIDTYSRVDMPPVNNLRRVTDGKLVCELEKADISELREGGWEPPEVFVAKARDGKTDIWGIICRPAKIDDAKKYPVLEQIYAGPQGAYVPKSFSGARRFSSMTDLGFIVVQMDGMGTAFRSKAFHDVCWHNLKDAGFEDRILWHKAVGAKYSYYDLSRIGIFGTSAGGQNAGGAVLFHPEFYKAAVANSGCHDNRMDKASWNEQWMGYPVGPQYTESSNIDNAAKLRGKLFLIVGELDSNVPPESTMRYVDALIRANKDFDLLVVPGADHGISGPAHAYSERRMRDFFVHNLMATEPPDRNAGAN